MRYNASNEVIYFYWLNSNEWNESLCLDVDKLSLWNSTYNLSFYDILIDCGDPDADIECDIADDGKLTVVNDDQRITGGRTRTTPNAPHDCTGQEWFLTSEEGAGGTYVHCAYSSDDHYYNIGVPEVGTPATKCEDIYIWYKNVTVNPYFNSLNSTETTETLFINETVDLITETDEVYIFLNDLGYIVTSYSNPFAGDVWVFRYDNFWAGQPMSLSVGSGTHARASRDTSTQDSTLDTSCISLTDQYTGSVYFDINSPYGYYDTFCHNMTANSRATGYRYTVLKVVNNTGNNFDAYLARYTTAHTNIYSVDHSPSNPAPNMTVTVYWYTTSNQNGTLIWRMKGIGNWTDGWSAWVSIENTTLRSSHAININGTNILENYQYQYFVKSGSTTENNSGIYYNFTVGGTLPLYGWEEDYVYNATEDTSAPAYMTGIARTADALGIDRILMLYAGSFLILVMLTLGAVAVSHNPVFGAVVFVIAGTMLSLFGWLPYYVFILIAVAVSLAVVVLLKGAWS